MIVRVGVRGEGPGPGGPGARGPRGGQRGCGPDAPGAGGLGPDGLGGVPWAQGEGSGQRARIKHIFFGFYPREGRYMVVSSK